MDIQAFEEKGFTIFTTPSILNKQIHRTIKSWKEFCNLKLYEKRKLEDLNRIEYLFNTGTRITDDYNETISINFDSLIDIENKVTLNTKSKGFIKDAKVILELSQPLIKSICNNIENSSNISLVEKFSYENIIIKFSHYFKDSKENSEILKPHIDEKGITILLFESTPGFEYLTYEKQWLSLSIPNNKVIVFPGFQLQLFSHVKFRAICHRVIANKGIQKHERFSISCYIKFSDFPTYNKEKFGDLKDMKHGFNYFLREDKLRTFFKN